MNPVGYQRKEVRAWQKGKEVSGIFSDLDSVQRATGIFTEGKNLSSYIESLYPNPALNEVSIRYRLTTRAQPVFRLYDATGKLVRQWPVASTPAGAGVHTHTLSLGGLPQGLYTLQIGMGSSYQSRRLVIAE